jgi:hypothetical protein
MVDAHHGGVAEELRIANISWGRLVDIYDTTQATDTARLIYRDIVIGEDVRTEEGKWALSTNPVTGRVALTIERENSTATDDPFDDLVLDAQRNLGPVLPKGTALTESPPFSFIARNSCMVVQFDDLIDPDSIALNDSVKIAVGNPPVTPFDARLLLDTNHGGISAIDKRFYSTRLIVDMTINQAEQLLLPEPLGLNGAGLPASVESLKANVALRIPTRIDESAGQFQLLTNLKGRPLATDLNGPVDFGSSTVDVVRALRSGNGDDPNNGFMIDLEGPQLIGRQGVQVTSASADPEGLPGYDFVIGFCFNNPSCALDPAVGDVVQIGTQIQLSVTEPGIVSQGTVAALRVSLPAQANPVTAQELAGSGQMATPWRSSLPAPQAPCFLRFAPEAGTAPNLDVMPHAQVLVEFSEAIDPASVRPFDSFFLRQSANSTEFRDFVVGDVYGSSDLREFRFSPLLPLSHQIGNSEAYFVDLISSATAGGITDLAGNPLQAIIPQVSFVLAAEAPSQRSDGFVLRFNATSEDDNPGIDLRGQFLYNLNEGEIRPRPFSRFPAVCDRTVPIVSQMQVVPTGLQTPLSNLGSKLHILWRYCDVGLPQAMNQEDVFANLDVEGLSLSPLGGQVTSTFYPQFEMRLGHSARIPDEGVNAQLLPRYPFSGFLNDAPFAENYLSDADNPPVIVHPKPLGFLVSSSEVFTSATGTTMVHFPMNRTVAPEDKRYFTWRDTAVQSRGGLLPSGLALASPGVPVSTDVILSGAGAAGDQYGTAAPNQLTPPGIPTVGLPLLMEFRCYPGESLSVNNFDVSIAINSAPRPFFRSFSTGGYSPQGTPMIKDPDSDDPPSGGFNGNPQLGQIGAVTLPQDPTVYMGQLDLVTRVSRVHTVLFNSLVADPDYAGAVVEPRASLQPLGTSVIVAYRGDDSDFLEPESAYFDSADLDVYGEMLAISNNGLLLDNSTWSNDINPNDGQRYVQLRLTFISNPITELSPRLSGLGVAWRY